MLKETFYLDGIDAESVGIKLQSPISFSKAVPVVETNKVPGRNGNLIHEIGSYENRSGSASCFCLQKDVEKAISSAGRFLMGKKGYRRLETSDDPDHYWMARVENSPQIAMKMRTIAPFEIGFDCKPQRFLKAGENPIQMENGGFLFNKYGQVALPIVKISGYGSGNLFIGDCAVEIKEIGGTLYLDSETQNAYNGSVDRNESINAPVFPELTDGMISVSWNGGIDSVEIIPRWWEL